MNVCESYGLLQGMDSLHMFHEIPLLAKGLLAHLQVPGKNELFIKHRHTAKQLLKHCGHKFSVQPGASGADILGSREHYQDFRLRLHGFGVIKNKI